MVYRSSCVVDPDDLYVLPFCTYPSSPRVLNYDLLPENVKRCEYAVRGELYRAAQTRVQAGKEVIFTNVGNPHGLGQKPLTFIRQVFALVRYEGSYRVASLPYPALFFPLARNP